MGVVRGAALLTGGMLIVALGGCGGASSFKNNPRPPVAVQLTGVITDKKVTVSPNRIGAGPVHLIVSNQTQQAHTIVLERAGNTGEPNRDVVGPVSPLAAAPLQQDLTPGSYTVSVDSSGASIQPATIEVGPPRRDSSGTLLLP